MSERIPREFRDATPEDEPFIFSAWLRSHNENGDWPHRLGIKRCLLGQDRQCGCCKFSHRRYFDEHKHVVLDLLRRSKTIVACNPARHSQILGFVTFEERGLHWVDVKKFYRRNGIATELLQHAEVARSRELLRVCSHWSTGAENLLTAGFGLSYDPFLLGGPKDEARTR